MAVARDARLSARHRAILRAASDSSFEGNVKPCEDYLQASGNSHRFSGFKGWPEKIRIKSTVNLEFCGIPGRGLSSGEAVKATVLRLESSRKPARGVTAACQPRNERCDGGREGNVNWKEDEELVPVQASAYIVFL